MTRTKAILLTFILAACSNPIKPTVESRAPYLQHIQAIAMERKTTLTITIPRHYHLSVKCSVSLRWEKDGETGYIDLKADTCEQAAKLVVERFYK